MQLEQIKAGLAWPYEQYASNCPVWNSVKNATQIAKIKRIGIWSKRNSMPPWEFRKQQRQKEKELVDVLWLEVLVLFVG